MNDNYYKKYEPIFGKWKIVKQIGEGNHGKIFLIENNHDDRIKQAALKVITVPPNESEVNNLLSDGMSKSDVENYYRKIVNNLVSELQIINRLKDCKNIVSYEEFVIFEHSDYIGWDIFIRMEILMPLSEYIMKYKMTPERVIQFGMEMCGALRECENNNIIHRDIKPENIFFSKSNHFKLGDFAVAKVVDNIASVMSRKGTYTYMAPEVFRGELYDHTADIYSLGIVMYKLLNKNRTPFLPLPPTPITYADKEKSIFNRMKGDTLPSPVFGSAGLKSIVLKACAYQKERRYASANEMLNDLVAEANTITYVTESEKNSSAYLKQDNIRTSEAKQQLKQKKHSVNNANYSKNKKNTNNKNFNKKKGSSSRKKKITIVIFASLLIAIAACMVMLLPQ